MIGGVIPPPWPQLQATNGTAIKLKYWLDLAERVAVLPDDIGDELNWQAQQLLDKVSVCMNRLYKHQYGCRFYLYHILLWTIHIWYCRHTKMSPKPK